MKTLIKKKTTISNKDNLILLCDSKSNLSEFNLTTQELNYIKKESKEIVAINQYSRYLFVVMPKKEKDACKNAENCRMLGDSLSEKLKDLDSEIKFINFDNIPDSLFLSGKPGSTNTNKANSQRCSIVFIKPSQRNKIYSSKLISWKRDERKTLFKNKIVSFDITNVSFGNQFVRPCNQRALKIIKRVDGKKVKHFLSEEGKHNLYLASVARNFISFRKKNYSQSIILSFRNKDDFLLIFAVLNSREFFYFWKSRIKSFSKN